MFTTVKFFFSDTASPTQKWDGKIVIACACVCSVVFNSMWPHETVACGTPLHGTFPTRILEWIAISFSRGCYWLRDRTWVSCVSFIAGRFFTAELLGIYLLAIYLLYISMTTLITRCRNTYWKEQLWNKIISGTQSKILLTKYSMSTGYFWMFFYQKTWCCRHGNYCGGPWAQASKEIKSWLNQIMSWESKNGNCGPGQGTPSH